VFNLKLKRPLAAVVSLCLMIGLVGVVLAKTQPTEKMVTVKVSDNLYQDAQLAKQKGVPLVVMFSQDGCIYCDIVREQFLKPMLRSGDYKDKAIIREVKIDSFEDVRSFDGKMVPSDELATVYRAYLTPTVVVFNSKGQSLHRILGIANEHYYGGELDDAIDKAYSQIHRVAANN